MPTIHEYDYYNGTLTITVVTQRPDAEPSTRIAAASLHEEYAARARSLLREYKRALDPFLEFYRIEKMQPAGTARDTDEKTNQDFLRLQFTVELALLDAAWTADEIEVFAIETNIERAVHKVFAAGGLPDLFIPGNQGVLGESYIGILFATGSGTNIGEWQVPG